MLYQLTQISRNNRNDLTAKTKQEIARFLKITVDIKNTGFIATIRS